MTAAVDVTVVNTISSSAIQSSQAPTDRAETAKTVKYKDYIDPRKQIFFPAAIEWTGAYGSGFESLLGQIRDVINKDDVFDDRYVTSAMNWLKRCIALSLAKTTANMVLRFIERLMPRSSAPIYSYADWITETQEFQSSVNVLLGSQF